MTSIIPYPQELTYTKGSYTIPGELKGISSTGDELHQLLQKSPHVTYEISPQLKSGEAYSLRIGERSIHISASAKSGFFYGSQTLGQILYQAEDEIPEMVINDEPRFGWRGFMLDTSRFFQPVEQVLELIEILSYYKYNILHLHLTDDQGWRLEIPAYPQLTGRGARRENSLNIKKGKLTGEPHEGFYSHEDIQVILDCAARHHMTVIPEIDVPGHCRAALAAYPELGCTGGPYTVPWKAGIYKDILCSGSAGIEPFLKTVIETVADLFPSPYIHIGGDEVPKARWRQCPACRNQRKREGIKTPHDQQVRLTNKIIGIMKEKGKKAIVWSEICSEQLDLSATGQYWLPGKKRAYSELGRGRKMVFSAHPFSYFDMSHSYITLKKAYSYNPGDHENILGIECPLWTEWVPHRERLSQQIFPRLQAYSEAAWTRVSRKDYKAFEERLENHLLLLDEKGLPTFDRKEWNRGKLSKVKALFRLLFDLGQE